MIAGIIGAAWLHPPGTTIETLGSVPAGLPVPGIPAIQLSDVPSVLWGGLAVAIAAVGEGLSAARLFAADGQLPGQRRPGVPGDGAVQHGCGVQRRDVGDRQPEPHCDRRPAGGRTQITSAVTAVCVLVVLVSLTGVLTNVPRVILSAIVIASVWPLLAWGLLDRYRRVRRNDFVAAMTGLLGVLLLGPLYGLLAAMGISMIGLLVALQQDLDGSLGQDPRREGGLGCGRVPPGSRHDRGDPRRPGQCPALLGQLRPRSTT